MFAHQEKIEIICPTKKSIVENVSKKKKTNPKLFL